MGLSRICRSGRLYVGVISDDTNGVTVFWQRRFEVHRIPVSNPHSPSIVESVITATCSEWIWELLMSLLERYPKEYRIVYEYNGILMSPNCTPSNPYHTYTRNPISWPYLIKLEKGIPVLTSSQPGTESPGGGKRFLSLMELRPFQQKSMGPSSEYGDVMRNISQV